MTMKRLSTESDNRRLLNAWKNLDIDGKDISFIRNLYWNQKAYMRTEDGLSPEIHIKRGVRQGCVITRLLGRILKVGVQNFKQGVQGSNVHVLFNPASPRRSPFLSRETPRRSPISRSRC